MATDMQQLQQQMTQLMQQMTTMSSTNEGLMQHIRDKDVEHRTKIDQLEKMVATLKSDRDRKSLVDQKSLSKMKVQG